MAPTRSSRSTIDGSEQLALTKDVQVDPIRRVIEHLDFVAVVRGEKVTVDVPIHVVGDAAPETLVVTENTVVSVEAEATHIPEFFEVSVEGAAAGTQIHAKDLDLPSGTTLLADEELLIVNVTEQISAEALEAELEEAEAEAGIEHDVSDAEIADAQAEAEAEDAARVRRGHRLRVTHAESACLRTPSGGARCADSLGRGA